MRVLPSFLPRLSSAIWILFGGRLLSAIGTGFVLFYSAIFFTGEIGFTYSQLGLGIASGSLSGIVGRFLGGQAADTPGWGRRRTLQAALAVSALGAVLFGIAGDYPLFVVANLVAGLGVGLYWPASEAMIADLTTAAERGEAYGLTRAGDSLGLGLGAALGAALVGATGSYRLLFWLNALSFLVFFAVVAGLLKETRPTRSDPAQGWTGWRAALGDRHLLLYILINVCFTLLIAQLESTLPVYLRAFAGLGTALIGVLFACHVGLVALVQLPIARWLNRWSRPRGLMISAVLWALTYTCVLAAGAFAPAVLATVALALAAFALAAYNPSASALVADLAPVDRRGIYLSLNSQCWAVGYALGPALGGVLLDQPRPISDALWPLLALGILASIPLLARLERMRPA